VEQNVGHDGEEKVGTKENKSLLELSQRPKYHPNFFKNIFPPFSGVRGTYRKIIIFDSGSPLNILFIMNSTLLHQPTSYGTAQDNVK
jgi:hypothetical protein